MTSLLAGLPLMIGVALGLECGVGDVEPGGPRREMHGTRGQTGSLAADSLFRFHSRFWPNLHHFAYEQALLTADPHTAVFFVPNGIRQGLWHRDEERQAESAALQEHWQPYLEGEAGFESAIAALVADLQ